MKGPNARLSSTTLPIMPHTGRELRRLLDLKSTRNQQLQDVLLSDPAAAVAVFRELERARPGASDQVGDAAHALSLIGIDAVRGLLDTLPEIDPADRRAAPIRASNYSDAAHAAFYAGEISLQKGLTRRYELSTAALLLNPAILALSAFDPESAQRAANAVSDGVPAETAFGAELGEPLSDANLRLAEDWALPLPARQALGHWNDLNPHPQAIKLADGLARATAIGWQGEHIDTMTTMLANFLGFDKEADGWLHSRSVDAARKLRPFDYPLPGFRLPMMPDGIDNDEEHDDENIPELGSWRHKTAPPQATPRLDLHSTMGDLMKRIRDEAGTARVVFAMLDKDRSRLRTRLALGGAPDDGIRSLDLDLRDKTLFGVLMAKPQSVWLNRDNAGKYRAYLPDTLRRMLAPQGAYMMSLFVGDKPLGLMYGDGSRLSENGYRHFRTLCNEATTALTAGSRANHQT